MARPSPDEDSLPRIILPLESDSDEILQVTPIMVAAYHGDVRKVSSLLQKDSQSIYAKNMHGQTPLSYAIDQGHMKIIDILLAYGADIDDVNSSGESILHRCIHHGSISKVETCLTIGVNTDIIDINGNTPLIIAAANGREDITRLLIASGCDRNTQNREGLDALEQSFCSNHTKVQSILFNIREIDTSVSWWAQMLQACKTGNELIVMCFIQKYGTKALNFRHHMFRYQSPMIVASHYGHLGCCELLRASGAYVDTPNDTLDTPLIESTRHNNLEVVRWLILQGARVNWRNLENKTALHYAVLEGNLAIVKHLLENGALLHYRASGGYTALHMAAALQCSDILEYLLQQGAVADVRTADGVTPLLHAVEKKNIDMVRSLVNHGASVNGQDYFFHSPLYVAIRKKAVDIVTYLIENGADVDATASHGISLTEFSLLYGSNGLVSALGNVNFNTSERQSVLYLELDSATAQTELFQMCSTEQCSFERFGELLGAGASVNVSDGMGRTPLIVAAQNNCRQCVQWLLSANANIFTRDNKYFTALQYAVINGNKDRVQLLLQKVGIGYKSSEDVKNQLDRALSLCITENSNSKVENMKQLLEHESCTLALIEKSITAENVEIVELLFNYQLQYDLFEPGIVTAASLSSNLEIVQLFSSFMYKSQHQSAYLKCAVRFSLANQLEEAIQIFATKPIKTEDIFWSRENLWFCSDHVLFRTAAEVADKQGLNINPQSKTNCTLLIVAASKGMDDVVEYLLKKKATNFDINGSREHAFHVALDLGHYEIATLLSEEPLVVTDVGGSLDLQHSLTDCNIMRDEIGQERLNISTLLEDMKTLIYNAVIQSFSRKPEGSVCLVKRTYNNEAPIVVTTTEKHSQSPTFDHILDVPFNEYFDVKYVHNGKRASPLTMPCHANNLNVERKDENTYSATLTQEILMDILRQNDATIVQSRILKRQGMLWLIMNDILKHSPRNHNIKHNDNETALLKYQAFSIRTLNKRKSVNVTAFMVPQEVLLTILPKKHCLDYVYSGPDEAMMHRDVIRIGLKKERTHGKIIDVNVSFQDQQGNFYHGAFVVVSMEQSNIVKESECSGILSASLATDSRRPFALPGNSGAAVVDKESGIVLGLVVATLDSYDSTFKHLTFCLRLNYAFDSLNEVYNLGIGTFRTFEI